TAINNTPPPLSAGQTQHDWDGVQFGEQVGIWFHPSKGTRTSYNPQSNKLTQFSYHKAGWFDTTTPLDTEVTEVPEPQTLIIFAVGLLGFSATRKFRLNRKPA
ncbi:MAG: PEP-CTERM sorting domain-containing protein, partial [Pseudomonadota bacterium]